MADNRAQIEVQHKRLVQAIAAWLSSHKIEFEQRRAVRLSRSAKVDHTPTSSTASLSGPPVVAFRLCFPHRLSDAEDQQEDQAIVEADGKDYFQPLESHGGEGYWIRLQIAEQRKTAFADLHRIPMCRIAYTDTLRVGEQLRNFVLRCQLWFVEQGQQERQEGKELLPKKSSNLYQVSNAALYNQLAKRVDDYPQDRFTSLSHLAVAQI